MCPRWVEKYKISTEVWDVILSAVQVLFSAMVLVEGVGKVLGYEELSGYYSSLKNGNWLCPLVGVIEIIGAFLLLVPTLSVWAAAGLLLIAQGSIYMYVFVVGKDPTTAVSFFLISLFLLWGRRDQLGIFLNHSEFNEESH